MGKKTALKVQRRDELDAQWGLRLKKYKKDKPKTKGSKKKSLEEIKKLIELPDYIEGWEIRNEKDWKATSYNIEKQKLSYLSHLYVKYPVPDFLFQTLLSYNDNKFKSNVPLLVEWFLLVGQGGSFRKEAKNYFNKKEAHVYLNAPNNKSGVHNFWWAKCVVAGVPESMIDILIERLFNHTTIIYNSIYNATYKYYVLFFSKYGKDIDKDTFTQIIDYISAMRRQGSFSMKGRTLSSVIKMSNDWHRTQYKLSNGRYVAWEGIDVKDWKCFYKDKNWSIKQLKNSTALYKEGQKQRHCVGSYAHSCANGTTFIFTMDSCPVMKGVSTECYEKNITIEISNNRSIRQVRGKMNRHIHPQEEYVLRLWAGANGFTASRYL